MKTKNTSVGAFDAKTNLARLLERVRKGEEITITKRGTPVARLVPVKKDSKPRTREQILSEFDAIRNNVKGKVSIKSYINEGRKY